MHLIIALALTAIAAYSPSEPTVELQAAEMISASVYSVESCKPSETIVEPDAYIVDLMARTIYAEARGCSTMEQAAVAWCVLNRVDAGYGDIEAVLTAPHQFATWSGEVGQEQLDIAADVLTRWEREKLGCPGEARRSGFGGERTSSGTSEAVHTGADEGCAACEDEVGRVLPLEYLWFTGDGVRNYFRDAYEGDEYWDWGLESPYEEEEQ